MPVEQVERAGTRPGFFADVIGTVAAIVRHAVDIGARCSIRFRGKKAAVGEQGHAMRVGQFHPFIGICVNRQIPLLNLARFNAGDQREGAGDHQALDMMGIGVGACFLHDLRNTVHFCFATPVAHWQRAVRVECIAVRIIWHAQPVDAAHIFTPAQDLADESFHGIERRGPLAIGVLRRQANLARRQQAAIQIGRDRSMKQERLALFHGVLIVAVKRQAGVYEIGQRLQRAVARHRPAECVEVAEMRGKARGDKRHDIARDSVG